MSYTEVKRKTEILPLTGIRAFAAWWVVLFHIAYILASSHLLYWLARLGFLGVDLFFVLSGFIISYNYWQRFSAFSSNTYWRFLWARLARIYPIHVFTLILSLFLLIGVRLSGVVTTKDFSTWTRSSFLANVVMVHAWRLHYTESWNNASWSISCEWFAYLVFPLLVLIGLRKLPVPVAGLCAVFFPAILAFSVQSAYALPCVLLIQVMCEFTAGCLVYHIYMHWHESARVGRMVNYGAISALAFALILLWQYQHLTPYWVALVFPIVILAVAKSSGIFASLVGSKPAVYWGKVSYSLYMTHNLTLWFLKGFLPVHQGGARSLPFFVYVGSIGVVAAFTYHFVEEPARRWMRDWSPFSVHPKPVNSRLSRLNVDGNDPGKQLSGHGVRGRGKAARTDLCLCVQPLR